MSNDSGIKIEIAGDRLRDCPIRRIALTDGIDFRLASPDAEQVVGSPGSVSESFAWMIQCLRDLVAGPGRVLDLGAHHGSFALASAALGHDVLTVEASNSNVSWIEANRSLNDFAHRLRIVAVAVGDREGTLEFVEHGPYGHARPTHAQGPSGIPVPLTTVDRLLAEVGWDRVDFVKLDIEGSEPAALSGMERLLGSSWAPPIYLESNGHTLGLFGKNPQDLKRLLARAGYLLVSLRDGTLERVEPESFQSETCIDLLALPPRLREYRDVRSPATVSEQARRASDHAASPNLADRLYLARALRTADPRLRATPELTHVVRRFRFDPEPEVREAASAIPEPTWARLRDRIRAWRAAIRGR